MQKLNLGNKYQVLKINENESLLNFYRFILITAARNNDKYKITSYIDICTTKINK